MLLSCGATYFQFLKDVVRSVLVVHTCGWSCIMEMLHTNDHHVIYYAHRTIKHGI
jgi:hypothetical protein